MGDYTKCDCCVHACTHYSEVVFHLDTCLFLIFYNFSIFMHPVCGCVCQILWRIELYRHWGCRWPEDSQPVRDSHSASQHLSLSRSLSPTLLPPRSNLFWILSDKSSLKILISHVPPHVDAKAVIPRRPASGFLEPVPNRGSKTFLFF